MFRNVLFLWPVLLCYRMYFCERVCQRQKFFFRIENWELLICCLFWLQCTCTYVLLINDWMLIFQYLFFTEHSTYCALAQIPLDARWMFNSVSESSFFRFFTSWLKRAGVLGRTSWLVSRHSSRRVFWAPRLEVSSSSMFSTCSNVNDLRDEIVSVTGHETVFQVKCFEFLYFSSLN